MTDTSTWIRSSHSDQQGGQCVEWAPERTPTGRVPVRDSKDTTRTPLAYSPHAWQAFVQELRTPPA